MWGVAIVKLYLFHVVCMYPCEALVSKTQLGYRMHTFLYDLCMLDHNSINKIINNVNVCCVICGRVHNHKLIVSVIL